MRIELFGKCQTQPADDKYYTVLEQVSVSGFPLGYLTQDSYLSNAMYAFSLRCGDSTNQYIPKNLTQIQEEFKKVIFPKIKEEDELQENINIAIEAITTKKYAFAFGLLSKKPELRTDQVVSYIEAADETVKLDYCGKMLKYFFWLFDNCKLGFETQNFLQKKP